MVPAPKYPTAAERKAAAAKPAGRKKYVPSATDKAAAAAGKPAPKYPKRVVGDNPSNKPMPGNPYQALAERRERERAATPKKSSSSLKVRERGTGRQRGKKGK